MLNILPINMVDFDLTEEQIMLIELAEQFADEELIPKAEKWDRDGIYPEKSINKARELGLLNCTIPQEYGGMGLSFLDEVMINEELGRGDPGFATITGVTMHRTFILGSLISIMLAFGLTACGKRGDPYRPSDIPTKSHNQPAAG